MNTVAHARDGPTPSLFSQEQAQSLARRLAETEAALAAMRGGLVDALLDPSGPLLLADAQKALRESEREFRAVFSGSSDALVVTDSEGICLEANPAAHALARLPDGVLIGGRLSEVFGLKGPNQWRSGEPRGAKDQESHHEITLPDGETRIIEYSTTPDVLPGKHLWIARDITERERAELERLELSRQLQRSQKLESLGVLAGGIAHDFNNILTSVLGNAELALSGVSLSDPARESLLEIARASHRAAALCNQMLAYSGRGSFAIESIDLNVLIEDMLDLLRSTISKKARLSLRLEKDLPSVEGDPTQLAQVIMNLVINASEAIGDEDGEITISTGAIDCSQQYLGESYSHEDSSAGLHVSLEVSDTGCGMDAATQARLFEPFYTTKFTGRGLGLSAVLGIVRGHKGALRLKSQPGKGTTIRVLLPASQADTASPTKSDRAEPALWRGTGTVLLVDDEETIRSLGTLMLASLGFTVLTAADGREALEVYAQHADEITLVLVDLTMPRMNGADTLHGLRLLDPSVRVVISSGYTEHDIASRFAGKGPTGFLQKPYTLAQMAERLRVALDDQ